MSELGDTATTKVLLDCDPGNDDALAILLAAGHVSCELLGITTVAGNQTIEKVTRNAQVVCTVAGIEVPIARGAGSPLVREAMTAAEYHGDSGLDGPLLPQPASGIVQQHAVEFIIDTLMSHDVGTINLVAIGPLTNIALALALEPRIAERVAQVVIMGGSYIRGNRTPAAEFNILADPEAASAVFAAPWPQTMVGLDLTHQALATEPVRSRIRAAGGEVATFVDDLFTFYAAAYAKRGFHAPAVHDPCALAAVLEPGLMDYRQAFVAIELAGTWTTGMTVTDFDGRLGHQPNTHVAISLDAERLWDIIIEALARLPRRKRSWR